MNIIEAETGHSTIIDPSDINIKSHRHLLLAVNNNETETPTRVSDLKHFEGSNAGVELRLFRYKCLTDDHSDNDEVDWEQVKDMIDQEYAAVNSVSPQIATHGDNSGRDIVTAIHETASKTVHHLRNLSQHVENQRTAVRVLYRYMMNEITKCRAGITEYREKYARRDQLLQRAEEDLSDAVRRLRETPLSKIKSESSTSLLDHVVKSLNLEIDTASDETIVEHVRSNLIKRLEIATQINSSAISSAEKSLNSHASELDLYSKTLLAHLDLTEDEVTEIQQALDAVEKRYAHMEQIVRDMDQTSTAANNDDDDHGKSDFLQRARNADHKMFESVQAATEKLRRQSDKLCAPLSNLYKCVSPLMAASRSVSNAPLVQRRIDNEARKLGLVIGAHDAYMSLLDETKRRRAFGQRLRSQIGQMDASLKKLIQVENSTRYVFEKSIHDLLATNEAEFLDELVPGIFGHYVPEMKLARPEIDHRLSDVDISDSQDWVLLDTDDTDEQIDADLISSSILLQRVKAMQKEQHEKTTETSDTVSLASSIASIVSLDRPSNLLSVGEAMMEKRKREYESLLEQFKQAEVNLDEKNDTIQNLEHRIQSLQKEISILRLDNMEALEIRDNDILDLTAKLQHCEMEKQELQISMEMEKDQSFKKSQNTITDLTDQIINLHSEIEKNNLAFEENKKKYVDLAEQQANLLRTNHEREMNAMIDTHTNELLKVRDTMTKLEEKLREVSDHANKLDDQNKELLNSIKEVPVLRDQISEYAALVRSMEANEKNLVDEHHNRMMALKKDHATIMMEKTEQIKKLQESILLSEHEKETMNREFESMVKDITEGKNNSQDQRIQDLEAQLEEKQSKMQNLEQDIEHFTKQLEEKDKMIALQATDLQRCKEIAVNCTSMIEGHEARNKEISNAKEKIAEAANNATQNIADHVELLRVARHEKSVSLQLQIIQQMGREALEPIKTAVPLLVTDLQHVTSTLVDIFDGYMDTLQEEVHDLDEHRGNDENAISERDFDPIIDPVSIDGVVSHGDRVVFVRAPGTELWRLFTTDEQCHIYMHPLSLRSLSEALPNHMDHIAISARVIMIEEPENNPLHLNFEDYKLAVVEFEARPSSL